MAIRLDQKTKTYTVSYCKRHPITRKPVSRRRVGILTKRLANQVYQDLILTVDQKLRETTIPSYLNVLNQFENYMRSSDFSLKTVDSYMLCLKSYTLGDWSKKLIDEINGDDIRSLIKEKAKSKSPSHQKNILKYIRALFNFAFEKGYINRNPTPKMKFKIGHKLKQVLTKEEVKKLLTQAKLTDSEWYPIWACALYTGMRNGELYALTWDKVDLDKRQIKVDCSWNNKDGFKDTKSGDDRIVEIADDLLTIFKSLKLSNECSPFVLPRVDKWDRGEQARELRRFLEGLGLPRIRFHDLRATWATILLCNGIEPIKVMCAGGWKDLKTMQFYVRKAGVDVRGITDGLSLHNPSQESAKVFSMT